MSEIFTAFPLNPTVLVDIALRTRGWMSLGPGPINTRTGGFSGKAVKISLIAGSLLKFDWIFSSQAGLLRPCMSRKEYPPFFYAPRV